MLRSLASRREPAYPLPMRIALAALLLFALSACGQPQTARAPANPKLDKLFVELATAPNAGEAALIEKQIWAIWTQSGSPTVDILLERAQAAEAGGDLDRARLFLDQAAAILPDYAEIYDRRAALAMRDQDAESALADINETLKREPRQFAALASLGAIYEGMGHEKAALAAYRDAVKLDPNLVAAKAGVARLTPKVEGKES